jgi:hypothetical protein
MCYASKSLFNIVRVVCDFITLAMPANRSGIIGRWRRRGFALDEHKNPNLTQALPRGYTPFVLTTGGCSCDLCRKHPRAEQTPKPEDAIALRDDAVQIVRELGPSFLYIHFYSGDISTEELPILDRVRRPVDSFTLASDPVLRDTLVEIIAQSGGKQA